MPAASEPPVPAMSVDPQSEREAIRISHDLKCRSEIHEGRPCAEFLESGLALMPVDAASGRSMSCSAARNVHEQPPGRIRPQAMLARKEAGGLNSGRVADLDLATTQVDGRNAGSKRDEWHLPTSPAHHHQRTNFWPANASPIADDAHGSVERSIRLVCSLNGRFTKHACPHV